MKNSLITLFLVLFFSACLNNDASDNFKDVNGLLYYEKPETGPVAYAVFLPFTKNNGKSSFDMLDSNDYREGIKFGIANSLIKAKLYSESNQKVTLKGGIDRTVYFLSNATIYFHIDKEVYREEDVIDKNLQSDTLVFENKQMRFKYRFSWIRIDSIKTN